MDKKVCMLCGKDLERTVVTKDGELSSGIEFPRPQEAVIRKLKKYGYPVEDTKSVYVCMQCDNEKLSNTADVKLEDYIIKRVATLCYAALEIREKLHYDMKSGYTGSEYDIVEWLKGEYLNDLTINAPKLTNVLLHCYLQPNEAYFYIKEYIKESGRYNSFADFVSTEIDYIVEYYKEYGRGISIVKKMDNF